MPAEPPNKCAIVFVDGQNLFHAAKEAFGYRYPNYDVPKLATQICRRCGWSLVEVRFYTGVPDSGDDPFWSHFWTAKLAQMGREGVVCFTRSLRYRNQTVRLADGSPHTFLVAQEKGIDIRLALDLVRLVREGRCDVALVLSQDQDLSEAADEVRDIAREQERWIKIASAYPLSPVSRNRRGVNKTDWIPVDRATYDACLDTRDYRPKAKP